MTSWVKPSISGAGSGVGFATPGWVVAHGDLESQSITHQRLEPLLPQSRSAAVATAGVGQDQQLLGRWKRGASGALPPVSNDVDREGWRVGRLTHVDRAAVVEDIVDTVGAARPRLSPKKS